MPKYKIYAQEISLLSAVVEADTYENAVQITSDFSTDDWTNDETTMSILDTDKPEMVK